MDEEYVFWGGHAPGWFYIHALECRSQKQIWGPTSNDTGQSGSDGIRASVLGSNDGIVSTASLVIGMAAAGASLKMF